MNTARTWLSMIGVGLTFPTLHRLHLARTLKHHAPVRIDEGLALVSMGILLIATSHHVSFISTRRRRRGAPASLVVALSLMMLGIVALSSMAFAVGRLF
jgi:uncharacterized membrane protein YidH (DUF202 family)